MTALPTRRLEAWRYTDLKALAQISFAAPPAANVMPAALPDLGVPRLVFVNGVFESALSSPPVFFSRYAGIPAPDDLPAGASDLHLVAINAGQARDGAVLEVPAGIDAGVLLLVSHGQTDAPAAFHPRHRIVLGAGAQLTIVEVAQGTGVYWHNPVTDITLAEGAVLRHYRLQNESTQAFHLATIFAGIAAGAVYESFSLIIGARLSRSECHARLHGVKAVTHLNAGLLLGGHQHGDVTTIVHHAAPDGASRQTVKSALTDHARGVFQGRIEVARAAQKTDGYQMNQALLLSPDAEMDIKPELEIFADDVKCSHGATIGALDEEQLFYLRSRGIPEAEARSMLIRAFLDEALAPVAHEAARGMFETAIESWWHRQ